MTLFILIAVALTIAAVAVVIVPLVRKSGATPSPAIWAALGATGLLVFGGGLLYYAWGNVGWSQVQADAVTPQNMVSRLARRLEKNPDDIDGWLRLGHSYTVLEQYPLAIRAYQKANELGGGKNFDAVLGLGEALVLSSDSEFTGRGAKFLEQALEMNPKSGQALFYGAVAAMRRGELPLARERFSALLTLDPPPADNVKAIFEQQIKAIDEQLAQQGGAGGSAPGTSGTEARTAGSPPGMSSRGGSSGAAAENGADGGGASGGSSAAAGSVPPVRVRVTLSAKLSGEALSSLPLFVFVRDPRAAGPPLAVKRLKATFPQTVEITTQDSMLPNHSFTKGQLVEVVARVSKSGGPVQAAGDLFGLAAHKVGDEGVVDIQVEHVSP
jgi:cytochrome c-type biogenesis protein CcmH